MKDDWHSPFQKHLIILPRSDCMVTAERVLGPSTWKIAAPPGARVLLLDADTIIAALSAAEPTFVGPCRQFNDKKRDRPFSFPASEALVCSMSSMN
ncbi:uncharacterized protein ATNIH1004_011007 [Aspergillus tanneri]|uniref:Uncharacterized protein n=1 Tax=Aspergillus tanneri TaxID=1220188 RepID=A0A5M9M8X3_9EURO|nr:uncharacterized protein ATNIH1004_011007 [Aspergillus tanneri]KAA8642066.1 hypothetical protein ATNIH1004_011007 [Aspergillus tanneri]